MDALQSSAERNLQTHMRWVQERTPGMRVIADDDLIVIDSGLPCDAFNLVCGARFDADRVAERIEQVRDYYGRVRRPFSWWVGPTDQPSDLGEALERAGLRAAESELGMLADLESLSPVPLSPGGLRIDRVRTRAQLEQFAGLLAQLWDPVNADVVAFYQAAAPALLATDCPLRLYLGTLGTVAVATAELTVSDDVAGLYNISTVDRERGRGIGSAMTLFPLLEARAAGCQLGVLQAAPAGVGIYRRVGFREFGRYTEYQP